MFSTRLRPRWKQIIIHLSLRLRWIMWFTRYYLGITNFGNYHSLNVGNSNVGKSEGTTSELPTFELPIRLVGIPNWLETFIWIARSYQHSELPISGIFNRNTECEPGYGLGYGLKYGLGYGLLYGLGYGLRYGLGYGLEYGLRYGLWVRVWVKV